MSQNATPRAVSKLSSSLQAALSSPLLWPLNDVAALDDVLSWIDPALAVATTKARVVEIIDETADTKTFVLAPNRHWNGHVAGQHVQVQVEIAGVRTQRTYTVSSAPRDGNLAITVKRQGKVSTHLHERLKVGDVLTLGAATGEFVLPRVLPQKILMISAGSGITPVMSMLRELAARQYDGHIEFVHACRRPEDAIFGAELTRLAAFMPNLKLRFHHSATSGRLTAQQIAKGVPDYAARLALLCGPDGFMQDVREFWAAQGLADSLRCEHFNGAMLLRRAASPGAQVQVACAKSEQMFDSAGISTLLDEAEGAGLKPKHGCRIGVCHSCKCKKVSGTVENLLTGQISSEPNEMIQLCVSAARSDVTLDL